MFKGKDSAALILACLGVFIFLGGCETTKHAEVMSAEDLRAQAEASEAEVRADAGDQAGIPLGGQSMSVDDMDVGERSIDSGTSATGDSGRGSISQPALSNITPEGPPSPFLRGAVDQDGMGGESSGGMTMGGDSLSEAGSRTGEMIARSQPSPPEVPSEFPTGNRSPGSTFGPGLPPQPNLGGGSADFHGADSFTDSSSTGDAMDGTMDTGPSGYEGQQFVRALTPSDFLPEAPPNPTFDGGGQGDQTQHNEMDSGSGSGDEVVSVPDHGGVADSGDSGDQMRPLDQGDLGGASQGESPALSHVFFDFDQFVVRSDAASTLQENATLLKGTYQNSSVLVEGHCDERGTSEYNMVLGERRATAVKNYLVDLGVPSSRIQIVSYGKERPACTESEPSCWQQNRRGHFMLQ